MRATKGASSVLACLTRVTSSPMDESLCRAGAIGKRSPQKIDADRLAPICRARAGGWFFRRSARQSRQEAGAQENAFRPLHREKTRYTCTNDAPDLPNGLTIGASKPCRENGVGSGRANAPSNARNAWLRARKRPKREQTLSVTEYLEGSERLIGGGIYHVTCHVRGGPRHQSWRRA